MGKKVYMKKLLLCSFFLYLSLFLVACEDTLKVRGANISEITAAGSDNYGVCVSFNSDSRIEELGVDVQLRFEKDGEIVFWEDNGQKMTFTIQEADQWYSLTNLIAIANSSEAEEEFVKAKEAVSRNYLFSSQQNNTISIRVVAGDIVENSAGTGYILTESMPISDVFKLKVNAKQQN